MKLIVLNLYQQAPDINYIGTEVFIYVNPISRSI